MRWGDRDQHRNNVGMEPKSRARLTKKPNLLLALKGRHITAQVKRGAKWRTESGRNRAQAWVVEATGNIPSTRSPGVSEPSCLGPRRKNRKSWQKKTTKALFFAWGTDRILLDSTCFDSNVLKGMARFNRANPFLLRSGLWIVPAPIRLPPRFGAASARPAVASLAEALTAAFGDRRGRMAQRATETRNAPSCDSDTFVGAF